MWQWLASFPSTNARIVTSLVMALATCGRLLASTDWNPSMEWLGFLIIWAGLDVAQFGVKRATQQPPPTGDT